MTTGETEKLLFCNKCGYVGSTKEHNGCSYFAAPLRQLTSGEETRLNNLLSGKRTNQRDRIVPLSTQDAARMLDEAAGIMDRAKKSLKHFAARYAGVSHAVIAAKEARLIIQEIDEWMLRR